MAEIKAKKVIFKNRDGEYLVPFTEYSGLEIGDIGIAPLGIDETKGKRRYLNGQLIIQEQYVQFTNKVKSAVALYPTLACTEEEWQTTATMTVGGQVGKFVVDDEAGTIRLPKIIMPIQGLTDLSKLAEIVEAGLPNITGETNRQIKSSSVTVSTPEWDGAFGYQTTDNGTYGGSGTSYNTAKLYIDASRSNPIYGNSNTVQQEQIQYPYFIQVATGAETEDNIINEIELNNPFSLLDYKFSEYELNNLSWLRSNSQWNSKAVYPAVYELLLKIYNGTEIKDGVSVKLTTETYTDYDFVLNTADETFMLPIKVKQKFFTGENVPVVGNGNVVRWTDISTKVNLNMTTRRAENAQFVVFGEGGNDLNNVNHQVALASSNSGIIAKISQTEVTDLYLYFYVGETVQNANLVNIGRIQETMVTRPMVDGQWVLPAEDIILNSSTALGTYIIDLSEYLPNDGYKYEIYGSLYMSRSDSSGTNSSVYVDEIINGVPRATHCAWTTADGANFQQSMVTYIAVVDNSRCVRLRITGVALAGQQTRLLKYRRLGTNA